MIITLTMRINISTTKMRTRSNSTQPLMHNLRTLYVPLLAPFNNTMRKFINITTHDNNTRRINSFRILFITYLRHLSTPRGRTLRTFRTFIRINNLMNNQHLRQKLPNVISRRISIPSLNSLNRQNFSRILIKRITSRPIMETPKRFTNRFNLTFNIRISTNSRPSTISRLSHRFVTRSRNTTHRSNSTFTIHPFRSSCTSLPSSIHHHPTVATQYHSRALLGACTRYVLSGPSSPSPSPSPTRKTTGRLGSHEVQHVGKVIATGIDASSASYTVSAPDAPGTGNDADAVNTEGEPYQRGTEGRTVPIQPVI